MRFSILIVLLFSQPLFADARQVDDYQWEGVDRVVAIGDLHGDYDGYLATLRAAGLVDRKGRWNGGETHLVQTGDIPDRGPDTLEIIEHLRKLSKQAKRKGGKVHLLIGNHEAMNVTGDLRYVHEGEFAAFKSRNSASLRDQVFELTMQNLQSQDPERYASLPENYREEFNARHPLGWVEHRRAWDPAWNPEAEYAEFVLENSVAIRINDSLFVHGGISGFYCQNTLDSLTEQVHAGLKQYDRQAPGILEDAYGPLWYRGLSGGEPRAATESVDAILARHGANRIVVGHTPTSGVIWPFYRGKVVAIDTGIAEAYGGYVAYLDIRPDGIFAGYPSGQLPLPQGSDDLIAYLEQVIAKDPSNPYLKERLARLQRPEPPAPEPAPEDEEKAEDSEAPPADTVEVPICGISP